MLVHELAHPKRRDNLIRLIYEVSLCALWFHPLVWLPGARMALYRELSCDESVIRCAHGRDLVSALAKLAVPEETVFLRATVLSHVNYRLKRLANSAQATHRGRNFLLTSLSTAVIVGGVFDTACCFILKR